MDPKTTDAKSTLSLLMDPATLKTSSESNPRSKIVDLMHKKVSNNWHQELSTLLRIPPHNHNITLKIISDNYLSPKLSSQEANLASTMDSSNLKKPSVWCSQNYSTSPTTSYLELNRWLPDGAKANCWSNLSSTHAQVTNFGMNQRVTHTLFVHRRK